MAAFFKLFQRWDPQQELYEPSPRFGHYAAAVDGQLYLYSGRSVRYTAEKEKLQSLVEVLDPLTETWTQKTTEGDIPPGMFDGACTSTGQDLFTFGGRDGKLWYGDLYSLKPTQNSLRWTRLTSVAKKSGCGIVCFSSKHLLLFAGYGPPPTDIQPGARFTRTTRYTDGRGWTNELHLFDLDTGVLSSPQVTGSRPPPCEAFTLTSVEPNWAVLFGGLQRGYFCVNDMYLFNIDTKHWTKVDKVVGEPWPEVRYDHAACCLDHGGKHPHLLMTGGVGRDARVLSDAWLLDVSTMKWKKLTLPDDETQPRFSHSTTAITLAPGLIEVIIFGGCPEWRKNAKTDDDWSKLAGTTILRFESRECPSTNGGPSTREWALVDVANNSQRGTSERLREKLSKIIAAKAKEMVSRREGVPSTSHASSAVEHAESASMRETTQALKEEKTTLQQRVEDAERQVQTENQRASQAEKTVQALRQSVEVVERRAVEVEERANTQVQEERRICEQRIEQAETKAKDAEARANDAETQAKDAETRAKDAEIQANDAITRANDAETRANDNETRANNADTRAQCAEHQVQQFERQWRVSKEEISLTSTKLGSGAWAEVKIAEFRGTRVAAKCFHSLIVSDYNLELFIREINMAARLRHPHLLQFVGASLEGEPIVLTELMSTSVRAVLEGRFRCNPLSHEQIISINLDVARALNYLHLMNPPLIHRDISSANVLLDPLPEAKWKAKVSDYGTVNLIENTCTVMPGNPHYAAPEAEVPSKHSPKMDIYSVGVLLVEMKVRRIPEVDRREEYIQSISLPDFEALVRECLEEEREKRPSASQLIELLHDV